MILWLHVGGGVLTLVAVVATVLATLNSRSVDWVRVLLPSLAGWQVVTGGILVFSGGSLLRVCGMGAAYLAITAAVYLWSQRRSRWANC